MPSACGARCTSPQRNTHISERRTVHYPWHPWRDRSVFIDGGVERNGGVIVRCHVEETQQWRALEIPEWMFGSVCSTMCVVDTPTVACEALRKLKVLLAGASNHDPVVKEAQRFEGGVDETDTEPETIAVRIVRTVNSHPSVDSSSIGGEAKNHPVTVTIVAAPLDEPTRPREQRGRR